MSNDAVPPPSKEVKKKGIQLKYGHVSEIRLAERECHLSTKENEKKKRQAAKKRTGEKRNHLHSKRAREKWYPIAQPI